MRYNKKAIGEVVIVIIIVLFITILLVLYNSNQSDINTITELINTSKSSVVEFSHFEWKYVKS